MGSWFDSSVYERRKHTPWARMTLLPFIGEMIYNDRKNNDPDDEDGVILRCVYRPDVASRKWWTLEWTGTDGQRHSASSQEYDLLLWRAAEIELEVQRKEEEKRKANKDASI